MVSFPGVMVVIVDSSVAAVSAGAQPVRASAAMAAAASPALMRDSVLFLDMVYISFCFAGGRLIWVLRNLHGLLCWKFAELYPRGLVHR
jgi:hypothetical protein